VEDEIQKKRGILVKEGKKRGHFAQSPQKWEETVGPEKDDGLHFGEPRERS